MGVWPAVSGASATDSGIDSGAGCLGTARSAQRPRGGDGAYGDGYLMSAPTAASRLLRPALRRLPGVEPTASPITSAATLLADQRRHQEGPRRRDDIHDADLRTISAMNLDSIRRILH